MKKNILITVCAYLAFACGNAPEATEETQTQLPDMHTGQIAVEYWGTYRGILPCADCEGVETVVILAEGDTYVISQKYLGKGDEIYTVSGSFSWDASGGIAIFDGMHAPNQFQIGENKLICLDIDGNVIGGDLAEKYVLKK